MSRKTISQMTDPVRGILRRLPPPRALVRPLEDACMDAGGRAASGTSGRGEALTENYSLFNPPAMYSDEELEAWGDLYCKLELHTRGAPPFERFMALPLAARRRCLRAALNPSPDLGATPAGGVSSEITPAAGAGDTSYAR